MKRSARKTRDLISSIFNAASVLLTLTALVNGAQPLLSGRVVDSGNQGIPGVEVHLVNKDMTATTGADGRFAVTDLG